MDFNDIIFGKHPVLEALEKGKDIDKVFLQQGIRGELEKEVRRLCKQADIPLQYVPLPKLNKMVNGNHQGLVAQVPVVKYQELEKMIPFLFEQGENPFILLLDGVTDVRNLGAIARSAEVLGVHTIVIPQKGGAWVNGVAVKSSAGALNLLPICRVSSIPKAVQLLQSHGIEVWAAGLDAENYLEDVDWSQPIAVVMGSEGEGISRFTQEVIDGVFKIPQIGQTDSLNVSVATGIICYEVMNRRRGA